MSCRGLHMALQRIVSLGLAIAFVATLGHLSWAESAGLLAAAAVSYVLWPVPAAPRGSHLYARGPAVVGPDVMGLVLVAFFAGLPLLAGRSEGTLLHPSLVLTWPMAVLFLWLLVIGWRRGTFFLLIGTEAIEMDTGLRRRRIPFTALTAVEAWRQDLVRRMRPWAGFLVAIGQPGAAGALLVSRPSRGVRLRLKDGDDLVIPGDAFEPALAALLDACQARAIAVAPDVLALYQPQTEGSKP